MRFVCALSAALGLAALVYAASPVPRPVTAFSFSDAGGKQISLSAFKGKVVLIQFLDTGCPHCQAMSRMLTGLQTELGPKGFQALGVAFNEATPAMVERYARERQTNFPVGFAPRDRVIECLGFSQISRLMVPQVMLIDRSGTIRAQTEPLGTPELQEESHLRVLIEELLKSR